MLQKYNTKLQKSTFKGLKQDPSLKIYNSELIKYFINIFGYSLKYNYSYIIYKLYIIIHKY